MEKSKTVENLQIDINDVIRLIKDGKAESLQIQKDTVLMLKVDREYFVPTLQQDIINIIQQQILKVTGKLISVFVTFKDMDLEQRTEAELIDMRIKCDLMIARFAEKRFVKRDQN